MKLIDLLNKISMEDIEPIYYFRINYCGYNLIIKYLYYTFEIIDVKTTYDITLLKKGDSFDPFILGAINYEIEEY